MTTTDRTPHDDDMPAEINFSDGVRGKFYQPDLKLNLPVYLNTDEETLISPDHSLSK